MNMNWGCRIAEILLISWHRSSTKIVRSVGSHLKHPIIHVGLFATSYAVLSAQEKVPDVKHVTWPGLGSIERQMPPLE